MKIVALLPGNCARYLDGEVSFNQHFIDSLTSSNPRIPPIVLNEISVSRIDSSLLDECCKALEVDDQLHPYLHFLRDPTLPRPPNVRFKLRGMKLIDGLVWYQDSRLYLPTHELRLKVLHERHDCQLAGHFGINKTENNFRRDFFIPRLHMLLTGTNPCPSSRPDGFKIEVTVPDVQPAQNRASKNRSSLTSRSGKRATTGSRTQYNLRSNRCDLSSLVRISA